MEGIRNSFLQSLAHVHVLASLVVLLYVLSPHAHWACASKHPHLCIHPQSIWTLDKYLGSPTAVSTQALEVCTIVFVFLALVLHFPVKRNQLAVVSFVALALVCSLVPWVLFLATIETSKLGRAGGAVWVSVASSLLLLVATSLGLASLVGVKPHSVDLESPLMTKEVRQEESPFLLTALADAAALALVSSLLCVSQLMQRGVAEDSPAKACMLVVVLLSFDCHWVCRAMKRKRVELAMGSVICLALSTIGWIMAIAGCVLAEQEMQGFEFASTCALISLLSLMLVTGLSAYLGFS